MKTPYELDEIMLMGIMLAAVLAAWAGTAFLWVLFIRWVQK